MYKSLDAVNPCSDGFEMMDYCGGLSRERGGYHNRAIPWRTFADTTKNEETSRLAHKCHCYRNMEGSPCIDLQVQAQALILVLTVVSALITVAVVMIICCVDL